MSKRPFIEHLKASARRALEGQTPEKLYAYSVDWDQKKSMLYMRAHFLEEPSEDDLEDISVAETEIIADFIEFYFRSDNEVGPAGDINPLAGGCAYIKTGQ